MRPIGQLSSKYPHLKLLYTRLKIMKFIYKHPVSPMSSRVALSSFFLHTSTLSTHYRHHASKVPR
jgi:hypothetical protein